MIALIIAILEAWFQKIEHIRISLDVKQDISNFCN